MIIGDKMVILGSLRNMKTYLKNLGHMLNWSDMDIVEKGIVEEYFLLINELIDKCMFYVDNSFIGNERVALMELLSRLLEIEIEVKALKSDGGIIENSILLFSKSCLRHNGIIDAITTINALLQSKSID